MHFEKERLLNLAGLSDNSPTELITEGAKPARSSEEQRLRRLVREELTRILQEREDNDVQYALKHRNLQVAFSNGTPGFASGMVHGNKGKVPAGQLRKGAMIAGPGFS